MQILYFSKLLGCQENVAEKAEIGINFCAVDFNLGFRVFECSVLRYFCNLMLQKIGFGSVFAYLFRSQFYHFLFFVLTNDIIYIFTMGRVGLVQQ